MSAPKTSLATIPLDKLRPLKRNPQYLKESTNEALKASIQRDGFLAPIVVRKKGDWYEVLSGNHRCMASRELGESDIACVVISPCDDKRAARIAVNMNTVHGDPTPELLAPFLADLDDATLREIHLDDAILRGLIDFDATLKSRLDEMQMPDSLDYGSPKNTIPNCVCKCGNRHVAAREISSPSKPSQTNIAE